MAHCLIMVNIYVELFQTLINRRPKGHTLYTNVYILITKSDIDHVATGLDLAHATCLLIGKGLHILSPHAHNMYRGNILCSCHYHGWGIERLLAFTGHFQLFNWSSTNWHICWQTFKSPLSLAYITKRVFQSPWGYFLSPGWCDANFEIQSPEILNLHIH